MAAFPLPHRPTLLEPLHGTGLHEHDTAGLVLRSLWQRTPAPDSDHQLCPHRHRPLAMPLVKNKSKQAFQTNIKREIATGKPPRQAVAIAYSVKRKASGRKR